MSGKMNGHPKAWRASVVTEKVSLSLDHQGSGVIEEEILGDNIFISIDYKEVKTSKPLYVGNGITVIKEEGMEHATIDIYYCKVQSDAPKAVHIRPSTLHSTLDTTRINSKPLVDSEQIKVTLDNYAMEQYRESYKGAPYDNQEI